MFEFGSLVPSYSYPCVSKVAAVPFEREARISNSDGPDGNLQPSSILSLIMGSQIESSLEDVFPVRGDYNLDAMA